jgi:hypothetical protein
LTRALPGTHRGASPTPVHTFGHTQETLHQLFDNVDQEMKSRIMFGAFNELFPDAPLPPGSEVA